MKTELIVTRWNIKPLVGCFFIATGLLFLLIRSHYNLVDGVGFSLIQIFSGLLIVWKYGPLKTVTRKKMNLTPANLDTE